MNGNVVRRATFGVAILLGCVSGAAAQGRPDIRWMRGGHYSYITGLVYSSDGSFFVSGAGDRTVKIWRASDGVLLRTLLIPGTRAIALSPDDATVCAGGSNSSNIAIVRCWQAADGAQLWSVDVPVAAGENVSHLAFSPDGTRLIAAAGFKLPVFDASNGSVITDFSRSGQPNPPYYGGGLAFSPDGNVLGVNTFETNGNNSRLALLDASSGSLAWDFGTGSNSVTYDVAFSPDSQLVASVNGLGLKVFGTYDHVTKPFHTGPPTDAVEFSPNGAHIATNWAGAGWLNLFNVSTGFLIRQWNAHGSVGFPLSMAFSPDSTKLLSGVFAIKRWRASDGSFDALVTGQVGPAWLLALSANEQVVATSTSTGLWAESLADAHVISLFRASDGALLRHIDYGSSLPLRGLALSPDGHHVAAADSNGLRVWNVDTGVLEHSHAAPGGTSNYIPVAYTPDGSGIAVGGDGWSAVYLWNPTTDAFTPIVAGPATALRFLPAPDGRLVVARQISPVAFPSVVQIVTLAGHVDREMFGLQSVGALAVSPDGKSIAAGGIDGAFSPFYVTRLWRVSDGATLQTLVGHTRQVNGVAFAWDSQSVITGAMDSTVRIWRASDGSQRRLYDGETYNATPLSAVDGVWSVVASDRSGRFLYGRGDATIVAAVNPESQPAILTFNVPAAVTGGCQPTSVKVMLDRPAPPAGLTLSLASSLSTASVPASLTFKAGATSKSFKITTTPVGALETATISATLDGNTEDRALGIRPIGVSSLTFSPSTISGGSSATGTVRLECQAAPADIVVNLASSMPSVAQPAVAAITIPQGATTGTFTVTSVPVTKTKKPAIAAATVPDAQSKSKKLSVIP